MTQPEENQPAGEGATDADRRHSEALHHRLTARQRRETRKQARKDAVERGECCPHCGVRLTAQNITTDRSISLRKGGEIDVDNLKHCCERCNELKRDHASVESSPPPPAHESGKRPKTKRVAFVVPAYDVLDMQAERLGVSTAHLIQATLKRAAKEIVQQKRHDLNFTSTDKELSQILAEINAESDAELARIMESIAIEDRRLLQIIDELNSVD